MAGVASASRSRPIRSAPCHCATGCIAAARAHRRKLMVRLVKGAYWDTEIKAAQVAGLDRLSGVHAQGRDGRILSRLRQEAARRERRHLSGVRHPQRQHHRPGEGARRRAASSNSSACTAWARSCMRSWPSSRRRSATRARRCVSTRRSAATRSCWPISFGGCSRMAPIPASSTASPTSRFRSTSWSRIRWRSSKALTPKRNPKIILPRDVFGPDRRNSAGVDLSDPLVREPLARALARLLKAASWSAKANAWEQVQARAVTSPHDRRIEVGTVFEASADDVDRMVRAGHAAQQTGTHSGAKARARLLDRAADLYEEHREEFFSLCIREGGKTLSDAVLEVREAVDFLRFYASEARRQFTASSSAARTDRRAE